MLPFNLVIASYRLAARLEPERCEQAVSAMGIKRSAILDYVYPNNVKIAAAQMRLAPYRDLRAFIQECCKVLDAAVKAGCHLVLFPHLVGLLPITVEKHACAFAVRFIRDALEGKVPEAALKQRFEQLMEKFSDFLFDCAYNLFLLLAHKYNIYIATGGLYVSSAEGVFCRSYLFSPDQVDALFQDKMHLNPLERSLGVRAGNELKVFDLKIGKTALLADTDSVYYECFKVAKALGAGLVLCPALGGESLPGCPNYNAALQHAQHFNLYAARASLCSAGDLLPAFPGATGIYSPLTMSKDLDGVLAAAETIRPSVVSARIDPPKLAENMDVYALGTGTGLCASMMNEVYPQFFKEPVPHRPLRAADASAEDAPAAEPPAEAARESASPAAGRA